MKKNKCIVFDFKHGKRENTAYYHYQNGQLDLDLKIEVMSPETEYGNNIIKFTKKDKNVKKDSCLKKQLPYNTA